MEQVDKTTLANPRSCPDTGDHVTLQIAKEKLRQFESARARGNDCPLPTKTPIPDVVAANVDHIKATKTRRGYKVDCWYLREAFGPVCPDLELPKERARTIRFLTLEQIDEQLRALENAPILQTMVAVYIFAGLRREEALWLTLEDVDLKAGANGVLHVREKTIAGEHWGPKTKVNRVVPISRALRAYLDHYQPRIVPGHWYFTTPTGCRWDADNFGHILGDANKRAHLPRSCLDYRHIFGSQLAMNGHSPYQIATLMGNGPEVSRKHCARLVPEAMAQAVEFSPKSLVKR